MNLWATRLATFFGVGWFPVAPGTAASVAALPFGFLFVLLGWKILLAFAALATAVGVWSCGVHARKTGVRDPSECVIDEVAGQWLALLPIAIAAAGFAWRPYVVALFLFRLFDMLKPWPISALEELPGGFGIMMDDIAAGAVSAAILYGIMAIDLV